MRRLRILYFETRLWWKMTKIKLLVWLNETRTVNHV